ncbi:MAG TPA: ABC transporter substrate-binding protein [Gammaproteobacteria bacterium]|nr:ABC transporter substrate-binding protein [Gammaproteobacteria bacterium]
MNRREWLARALSGAGAAALAACAGPIEQALSVGIHPFPGYEMLSLARQLGVFDEGAVRLIETPSASASLRALASAVMEGAGLTLDEVLTARSQGLDLVVVCVVDRSLGADAVLGGPALRTLADLAGCRIGVERSATGAVMLDAALAAAGLAPGEVRLLSIASDEHVAYFAAGKIDALVTYDPLRTRLLASGAHELFSSRAIPDRIVDTLALRREALAAKPRAVRALVDAHFAARDAWLAAPAARAAAIAPRLGLGAAQVPAAFAGLELPDRGFNRALFAADAAKLEALARELGAVMLRAGLLGARPDLRGLFDGRFV